MAALPARDEPHGVDGARRQQRPATKAWLYDKLTKRASGSLASARPRKAESLEPRPWRERKAKDVVTSMEPSALGTPT
jgi:hypothetical protein